MANAFDVFDATPETKANPFDQFDGAPAVLPDVAKSAGIGLVKGGIGLLGMGGDVRDLAASGAGKIGDMFGADHEKSAAAMKYVLSHLPIVGPVLSGPGSADIQKGIEGVTGDFYKPKTTAGEYAQTLGEFAPAALAGPGGVARRVATQVVAPALASETAGQATKGTEAEPYARVAGAVAGGGLSALHRAPEIAIPEAEQLRDAARAGYNHPAVAAVTIRPDSVERLADRITADLNRRGQLNVPEGAGATHNILDRLRDTGTTPGLPQGVASIPEIRSARMALSDMSTELNNAGRPTSNAAAAAAAGRLIDAYLNNLMQPDLLTGNARQAREILRDANQNWAAASKSSLVDLQQMKADRQAGRTGSGSNIENSMRQKIDSIFGPGKETAAGLTAAERAMADQIVEGSGIRNVLRKVGKLGFNDGLTLMAHAAATLPTGGANLPIGVAATIARKVGEGMTRREIARLEATIRGRSPEAVQWRAIQQRINAAGPPRLPVFQNSAISGALAEPSLQQIQPVPQSAQ